MDKKLIVVHHTAVTQPDLNKLISSMNNSHKARFNRKKGYEWSEWIQYHFVIWVDGEVRKLAPIKEVLYHASNYEINQQSIGVVLSWNFDKDKPTQAQYWALLKLIWEYKLPVSYHKDYSTKSCPWNLFDYKLIDFLAPNPVFLDFNKLWKVKRQRINKYFEYKQSKNDCSRFAWIGGLSDVIGRELSKQEQDSFLEFSSMFSELWDWSNILFQLNMITKRWNYNNPQDKLRAYIPFKFLKDRNTWKFMLRGYPIVYSRIAWSDFVRDRNADGIINWNNFEKKQRHATRFKFKDKEIIEINNYKWTEYNKFRYENFLEFIKNWNTWNFAVLYKIR